MSSREWRELTCEKVAQVETPLGGRQSKDIGIRKTAQELGLDKEDVRRAHKIASMAPEAQDKARKTGLDNNRSALLAAAKEVTAEGQVAVLDSWGKAHKKEEQTKEWNRLVDAWNNASTEIQVKFLRAIGSMSKSE